MPWRLSVTRYGGESILFNIRYIIELRCCKDNLALLWLPSVAQEGFGLNEQ